jgi:uncharacterized RDD family membrane protein YckC
MKAAPLRWLLLAYFVLLMIAVQIRSKDLGGSGPTWLDGNYGFEAGAPPWSLAIGVIGAGFFIALISSSDDQISRSMPHLFRRWIAGWIDWILAFVVPTPFAGLVFVWDEYRQTGVFKWIIQSQEPSNLQLSMIVLFILSSMVLYFAVPWWLGKPTPGACILGYRICPDDGSRFTFLNAIFRVLLGSVALLGWPSWIFSYFLKRDKSRGKFWLDAIFNTHAEYLT